LLQRIEGMIQVVNDLEIYIGNPLLFSSTLRESRHIVHEIKSREE
jgi:hypothetical protein